LPDPGPEISALQLVPRPVLSVVIVPLAVKE
jgi:hypothetical protein